MIRRISGTVNRLSTNGYTSYDSLTKVLNCLKVTEIYGNKSAENHINSFNNKNILLLTHNEQNRLKIRKAKYETEKAFVMQLWNKINSFLFKFIDSIILIDILIILFLNNSREGIDNFESYINQINDLIGVSSEDQNKNKEENKYLHIDNYWPTEKIFEEFKKKKPDAYQTDSVFGQYLSKRHANYFKEFEHKHPFSPKINRKGTSQIDYLQKRQASLLEIMPSKSLDKRVIKDTLRLNSNRSKSFVDK